MINFNEFMTNTNGSFWNQNLYPNLRELLEHNTPYSQYTYRSSRSRSLNDALYHTLERYESTPNINSYKFLTTLCFFLSNKGIVLNPSYTLITSQDAETLTLDTVKEYKARSIDNKLNINIIHVSKGKSYLSKILDGAPGLIRLKPIETICIQNINHFIRVYRDFGAGEPGDITIFSDIANIPLIQSIIISLPHLCGFTRKAPNEEYELTEEDVKYNQKYDKLIEIFEHLYNIYTGKTSNTGDLRNLIKEYLDLFNFQNQAVNDFLTNLANARNKLLTDKLTNNISSLSRSIHDYETRLESYYAQKANAERELQNIQTTDANSLMPFVETIQNTKAIETLFSSANQLKLRITAPLQFFTPEDFERYEANENSTYHDWFDNQPTLQNILHKIFVTREYKLLVQSVVKLTINTSYYDSKPLNYNAQRSDLTDFTEFPNPHMYHHDCWSEAKSQMDKNIASNNYELVVMQMVAATQTVNIAENASFVNGLLNDLKISQFQDLVHIVNDKGEVKTLNEMIAYERELKKQATLEQAEQEIAAKKEYTQIEIPDDDDNWDDNEI